ncbi:hypothetical protein ACFQHO_31040 [Actinomadura yumaensis]|uniref:hypothetical protein n=1 Tax=Actinomadura yumaensis TaxID=111807 RepID=UPI00360CE502
MSKAINELADAIKAYEKAQGSQDYTEMGNAWARIKKARDALAAAQKAAPPASPSPNPSESPTPSTSPTAKPSG